MIDVKVGEVGHKIIADEKTKKNPVINYTLNIKLEMYLPLKNQVTDLFKFIISILKHYLMIKTTVNG